MLKVCCVVDKKGTALDRLANGVAKYHDNIDYKVLEVHPKRPDRDQILRFVQEAQTADIIDWQYYRTAEMLRQNFDWLENKKHILTHNNPYAIEESDWNNYDLNVGNNAYITKRLQEITSKPVEYVPLTVDTDFWTYNNDWKPTKNVIMVANRIESKKGILEVAIACGDLNLRFTLVGAISDTNYFNSIMQTGVVDFYEQVSDEKLKELYHKSIVHVCNSKDNFESGTLPILEAMLCGVPVLTRKVGHVPDLYNGENMVLLDSDPEDVIAITDKLREMVSDKKKLEDLRDKGWNTAKRRSHERRAYMYQKLYRQVLHGTELPVSIIVPIYDKPDIMRRCFDAIADQTYKNIELIVVDDNMDANEDVVRDFSLYVDFPVRYINSASKDNDYGLARARNVGVLEATGDVLVFCDQRQLMEKDAIEQFMKRVQPKQWLFGNKGSNKKEFVENFSCVYRQDLINAGMFNERINLYGGQSQEIRNRVRSQGMTTVYVAEAQSNPAGKSSNRNRKRQDIIKMKNTLWKMGLE